MSKENTRYIYEDIRSCINEGISVKETAELCGCSENTVLKHSKDLRDVRSYNRIPSDTMMRIKNDLMAGMKPKDIAEKYNMKVNSVYAIRKRMKKREQPERRENVSNDAPVTESTVETASEQETECVCDIIPHTPSGISIFRNFTANFDGKYARYSIRDNKSVRVMVGNTYCELQLTDVNGIAKELIEISKMFA